MTETLKALEKEILALSVITDKVDKNNIPALCKHYKSIHEYEAQLEELYDLMKGLKQRLSYDILPTSFTNNKVDNISLYSRQFIISGRVSASIPAHMRERGHAWLAEVGSAALIIPTVNPKTLSGFVSSYIQDTGKSPPEDGVTVHYQPYTTMRKK